MKPSETVVLLRPRDAARALGVSLATLYRLIRRGELRCVKVGKCTGIPVAEIDRFVRQQLEGGERQGEREWR